MIPHSPCHADDPAHVIQIILFSKQGKGMNCKRCLGKLYFKHIITYTFACTCCGGNRCFSSRAANMTTLTEKKKELNGNRSYTGLSLKNHLTFLTNETCYISFLMAHVENNNPVFFSGKQGKLVLLPHQCHLLIRPEFYISLIRRGHCFKLQNHMFSCCIFVACTPFLTWKLKVKSNPSQLSIL